MIEQKGELVKKVNKPKCQINLMEASSDNNSQCITRKILD